MTDPSVLLVATVAAAGATGVVLIVAGALGGRSSGAARPPSRLARAARAARDPLFGARMIAGLVLAVVVLLTTRWPVAAAAVLLLVVAWPALFGARAAQRDRVAQLEALAMWVESLKDLVSGAAGLREAIPVSVETAPASLQPPLTRLRGLLAARESLTDALPALAEDLADPSADLVIATLILNARSRGPGLASALQRLAESIREELELRRRIEAGRRGDWRSVQIIVGITLAIGAAMAFLFPPQFTQPYRSVAGQGVLLIIVAIFAASFAWIRRLADPDLPDLMLTHGPRR
ncbi:MAG: type II secretion system protein [Jatrophihabitans sp.]|nr:MAG: type II secretion system protein [Jatrophihabitans sp.]